MSKRHSWLKGLRDALIQIHALLWAVLIGLLSVFAYTVQRIHMNMLGGLPLLEQLESSPTAVARVIMWFLIVTLPVLLVLGLVVTGIAMILGRTSRLIGYDTDWWHRAGLHPVAVNLIAVFGIAALVPVLRFVSLQGVLTIPSSELAQNEILALVARHYPLDRFLIFGIHLLATVLLGSSIVQYWSDGSHQSPGGQLLKQLAFPMFIAVVMVFLLPLSFAYLWVSNDFPAVVIKTHNSVQQQEPVLEGYMITYTSLYVVVYAREAGGRTNGRIHIIPQGAIASVVLSGGVKDVVKEHMCSDGEATKPVFCGPLARRLLWPIWSTVMMLGLTLVGLLVFAVQAPPADAGGGQASAVSSTKTEGQRADFKALLETFYRATVDKAGDLAAFLDDIIRIFRGEVPRDTGRAGTQLNIWRYNLRSGTLERLTQGGGYHSVVPSPDGRRIAVIQGKSLRIIDLSGGDERVIDDRLQYDRVLAWNTAISELLVADAADRIYRVREADGTSTELTLTAEDARLQQYTNLGTLIALSHATPEKSQLLVGRTDGGGWEITEDRETYEQPKALLETQWPLYEPVMMLDGSAIFFLAQN